MKLIRRGKRSRAKKGSAAPLQSTGDVDSGGGGGSNSRQVAPENVLPAESTTIAGYASSRDEAFYEASPWLDSDCEDDFFSVNGDATPARSFSTTASNQATAAAFGPQTKLPTLEAILQSEPLNLKPAPQMKKLGDLLKEKQEGADGAGDISRARGGGGAGRCCIPLLARVISYRERRN
ncbi:hypothetical protein CFC21_098704 [Triticum aestivum]|uniref:Uncharacterized protein n=2 Tax=Triticum aestivum TaxID=4565 RepID=A0A3B6RMA2_WHEAT|nr:uncharacterized protein At3g27210-like [Triticum aestivum]KAF7096807.1 hypothetical protein CFC21_098704 [Triticum aestivum]